MGMVDVCRCEGVRMGGCGGYGGLCAGVRVCRWEDVVGICAGVRV